MPQRERTPTKKTKRRRGVRKRVLLPIGGLLLLAIAVPVLLRMGLAERVVLPVLEAKLGSEVSASDVGISLDGRLVIEDLVVRTGALSGDAGELLSAERLVVELDRGALLGLKVVPTTITLVSPTFRIAVDEELRINLAYVQPPEGGGGVVAGLPDVGIVDGTLELAEFGDGFCRPFALLPVEGSLQRDPDDPSRARVNLEQRIVRDDGGAADLQIDGEVDLEASSIALRARAIDLARYRALTLPDRLQPLWDSLAFEGNVSAVDLTYSPAERLEIEMTLDGVAMRLPITGEDEEPLTVERVRGNARFTEVGFVSDVRGLIADFPPEIDLSVDGFSQTAPLSAV